MAFKLPTQYEILCKIEENEDYKLTPLEEFVYDEEPQKANEREYWRQNLKKAIQYCIDDFVMKNLPHH